MQRLFNRGHREEIRYVEWYRAIGAKVFEYDLVNNVLYYDFSTAEYLVKPTLEKVSENWVNVSDSATHIKRAISDDVKIPQFRIQWISTVVLILFFLKRIRFLLI